MRVAEALGADHDVAAPGGHRPNVRVELRGPAPVAFTMCLARTE